VTWLLALTATLVVMAALMWEVAWPRIAEALEHRRARRARVPGSGHDTGRERRAEHRARELLKSCVSPEEWAMYRDLGFIRVWGGLADGPSQGATAPIRAGAPYAYLVYPHRPVVLYLPQTRDLLNEYCVTFPDGTAPAGTGRLADSDDVLAKWMALTSDERRFIGSANMHPPGRLIDVKQVRRDLWRLSAWERQWLERGRRSAGSVPAP
jgi:hypothetical protein